MRPVLSKPKTATNTVEDESEYESEYSDEETDTPVAAAASAASPPGPSRSIRSSRSCGVLQAAEAQNQSGDEEQEDEGSEPGEDTNGSGSEFAGDDDNEDEDSDKPAKLVRHATNQDVAALRNKERKKMLAEKSKDTIKKVTRKVSATAHSHMNFKKLNIKNKNSKGKAGGRFGRRR